MSNQNLQGFRVVIRGTTNEDKRVRRVRTAWAVNEGEAAMQVAVEDKQVTVGLKDLYLAVLPPLDLWRAAREAGRDAGTWPFPQYA